MVLTDETWRLVPSAPHYMASSKGRIMVVPYGARMPHGGSRQYGGQPTFGTWSVSDLRFITVYKGKTYRVAPLVCEAFNGPKPFAEAVCMHLDENPANNIPSNLQWGTQRQNLNAPGYLSRRRKRPLLAVCAECSSAFEPQYADQKYCRRKCSHANNAAHSAARYPSAPEWR